MELLKGAAAFITWLSGSLAAIAGILYGFGYLATLSNLHSLGLNPLILSFDPLFYLQRGSSFTLYVLRLLFDVLLIPMIILVAITLLVLAIAHFWRERNITNKVRKISTTVIEKMKKWHVPFYALILLLLFWEMSTSYDDLTRVLNVSDLLYETGGSDAYDAESQAIRQALTIDRQNDPAASLLATAFLDSVLFLLEVAILFTAAWRLTAGRQFRFLLVAPFALALAMFFVSLPMIYGIIVLPNKFSTVRIAAEDVNLSVEAEYYLLNKTAQEFVVWDSENERLLWLPVKSVAKVEVDRIKTLPLSHIKRGEGR